MLDVRIELGISDISNACCLVTDLDPACHIATCHVELIVEPIEHKHSLSPFIFTFRLSAVHLSVLQYKIIVDRPISIHANILDSFIGRQSHVAVGNLPRHLYPLAVESPGGENLQMIRTRAVR